MVKEAFTPQVKFKGQERLRHVGPVLKGTKHVDISYGRASMVAGGPSVTSQPGALPLRYVPDELELTLPELDLDCAPLLGMEDVVNKARKKKTTEPVGRLPIYKRGDPKIGGFTFTSTAKEIALQHDQLEPKRRLLGGTINRYQLSLLLEAEQSLRQVVEPPTPVREEKKGSVGARVKARGGNLDFHIPREKIPQKLPRPA